MSINDDYFRKKIENGTKCVTKVLCDTTYNNCDRFEVHNTVDGKKDVYNFMYYF